MNNKTRLNKLEQHQTLRDSAEDIPESLSPFEQYKRLISAPLRRITTTKPSRSFSSPQEAYDALIGKDHELS